MRINEKDIIEHVDSKYTEDTLKIIKCLKDKVLPYKELKESKVFRAALVWILRYKGYTYISNKIYILFNKEEIDYKEVYEILINAKIINRKKIGYLSNLNFDRGIVFKDEEGINKSFFIKLLKDVYPFKIKYISNEYRGFVNIDFENREFYNQINVKITIPENIKYPINIREKIIVYTDYKIKIFELDIIKIDEIKENSFYDLKILSTLSLMKERTRRIVSVGKGIGNLERENNSEYAIGYLLGIKNSSIALEIFSRYKKWLEIKNEEIKSDFYIEFINKFIDINEINVKLGYLIEKFIIEKSLIRNNMKEYLEKFYEQGYITELTEEVLEILKFTDFSLEVKKKMKILDYDTLEDFREGNVSLEMASRILSTKGIKYDKNLVKIMYDFYEETDDVKALELVIKKKDKFNFKIKDGDIVSLINKKRDGIDVNDMCIVKGGKEFININKYIKDEIELIKIRRTMDKLEK